MWDLIAQIFFCLLLAFLLGALMMWLYCRAKCKRIEGELRAEWEGRLKGCEGKVAGLNADLRAAQEKAASLSAEAEAGGNWKGRVADLEAQLKAAQDGQANLEAKLAASGNLAAELSERDAKIAALTAQLGDCEAKVGSLNAQLTAAPTVSGGSTAAALMGAAGGAVLAGGDDDGELARLRGENEALRAKLRVYASGRLPGALDEAPADADNLEDIYGVGPVLAKMLNDMGIYYFRQVGVWTEDDIDYVDSRLESFKGRIRRENWVGSAKEEHFKKYGQKVDNG
jgi:predicted flap endonuclease-1-like 5' DNA nuclease